MKYIMIGEAWPEWSRQEFAALDTEEEHHARHQG